MILTCYWIDNGPVGQKDSLFLILRTVFANYISYPVLHRTLNLLNMALGGSVPKSKLLFYMYKNWIILEYFCVKVLGASA